MPMTQWLATRHKLKKKKGSDKRHGRIGHRKRNEQYTPSSFRGKDGADSAGSFSPWDIEVYLAETCSPAPAKIVTYIKSRVNFVCFRNVNRSRYQSRAGLTGWRSPECNNVPLILDSRASIVYLHSDRDRLIMKGIPLGNLLGKIDTRFRPAVLFVKTQESRRLQALYDQPFVPKPIDERRENQERIESLASAKINNLNRFSPAFTCALKDAHLSFTGPITPDTHPYAFPWEIFIALRYWI